MVCHYGKEHGLTCFLLSFLPHSFLRSQQAIVCCNAQNRQIMVCVNKFSIMATYGLLQKWNLKWEHVGQGVEMHELKAYSCSVKPWLATVYESKPLKFGIQPSFSAGFARWTPYIWVWVDGYLLYRGFFLKKKLQEVCQHVIGVHNITDVDISSGPYCGRHNA